MRIVWRPLLTLSCVLPACAGGGPVSPTGPLSVAPRAGASLGSDDNGSPRIPPGDGGPEPAAADRGDASLASEVDAGRVRPHLHDPGRSSEDIRAIVIAHRDEARACYDKALVAHPGVEGDLVMRWTIDPKGTV